MDELFADDTFILLTKDKALKDKTEEQISESGGAVARAITKRVCFFLNLFPTLSSIHQQ